MKTLLSVLSLSLTWWDENFSYLDPELFWRGNNGDATENVVQLGVDVHLPVIERVVAGLGPNSEIDFIFRIFGQRRKQEAFVIIAEQRFDGHVVGLSRRQRFSQMSNAVCKQKNKSLF